MVVRAATASASITQQIPVSRDDQNLTGISPQKHVEYPFSTPRQDPYCPRYPTITPLARETDLRVLHIPARCVHLYLTRTNCSRSVEEPGGFECSASNRGATHRGAPPEGERQNGKTGSDKTSSDGTAQEEEPGAGQGIQAIGAKG